jgi:hypothetical protein
MKCDTAFACVSSLSTRFTDFYRMNCVDDDRRSVCQLSRVTRPRGHVKRRTRRLRVFIRIKLGHNGGNRQSLGALTSPDDTHSTK